MTRDHLAPAPELTILTGGAGWFGRAFLAAVASPSAEHGPIARTGPVRALVTSAAEADLVREVLPHAETFLGDVTDAASLKPLFADAAGASVVHAAGVIHPHRAADFDRVNHVGTLHVLGAAQLAGARRTVQVSSNSAMGVNPTPTDVFRQREPYRPYLGYGRSKAAAERAVLEANTAHGMETVVIRPPWFYGPWQPERQTRFFTLVASGRFPILGSGDQRRSMVYVDNLVQSVALAERHPEAPGQAFWAADQDSYSFAEIVHTVRAVLSQEGYAVSARTLRAPAILGSVAERADRAIQRFGGYHQELHVLGELRHTIACDISRTREVLGYRPHVALAEGMRRSLVWCRERGIDVAPREA